MADSTILKRENHSDDNDPFAELTRIMGRDPRVSSKSENDPFEIDLERELMGEFEDDIPEAAAAPIAAETAGHDLPERAEPQEMADLPLEKDQLAEEEPLDAEMAAIFDDELLEADTAEERAEAEDAPLWDGEEDLPAYEEPQPEIAAVVPEPVAHAAAYSADEDDDLELPIDLDMSDEVPASMAPRVETGLADVDMDFGDLDLDDEVFAETTHRMATPHGWVVEAEQAPVAEEDELEWTPAAPAAELSLEDELSMLLSAEAEPEEAEAEAEPETIHAAPEPSYPVAEQRPNYSRANLTGAAAVAAANAGYAATYEPEAAIQEEAVAEEAIEELPEEPADDLGVEDELALDHEQFEPEHAEYQAPQSVEPAPDPFAVFGQMAPPAAPVAPAASAPVEYDDALDLDMVDVPEGAVAMADDLDLPELAIEEDVPASDEYDDFDAEFADMFRPADAEIAQPAPAAPAYANGAQASQDDDLYFEDALGGAASGLAYHGAAAAGSTHSSYRPHASGMADASEQDYDPELDREMDLPMGGVASTPPPPRRNGLLIAAVVAGVALFGGIGVFAFSGGGGTSDAPALVRADDDPLKVKPENPGGTAVPNQDSQAYQRAAGGAGDTVPAQERLLTTTEEPVDVAARVEPEPIAPGIELENGLPGVEAADKAEDRLTADEEVTGIGAEPDLVAVTPRRVRTMIVRPDGTLVPREELPAEAAAPMIEQQSGSLLAAAQPEGTLPTLETNNTLQAPGLQPMPAAQQPAEQNVPEAAAPAPQPAAAPAPVAPQPAAAAPVPTVQAQPAAPAPQVAAAPSAPRTAPAAPVTEATGEWSMQIASQPTAEGAQSTYQDLARRYSDLLSGRGVNIVRAEIAGKGTYYRVRIPSATRNDAVALCERYKSSGGSCFVSK